MWRLCSMLFWEFDVGLSFHTFSLLHGNIFLIRWKFAFDPKDFKQEERGDFLSPLIRNHEVYFDFIFLIQYIHINTVPFLQIGHHESTHDIFIILNR